MTECTTCGQQGCGYVCTTRRNVLNYKGLTCLYLNLSTLKTRLAVGQPVGPKVPEILDRVKAVLDAATPLSDDVRKVKVAAFKAGWDAMSTGNDLPVGSYNKALQEFPRRRVA